MKYVFHVVILLTLVTQGPARADIERPRLLLVEQPPGPHDHPRGGQMQRILYMNGNGVTLTIANYNDSVSNYSYIPEGNVGDTVVVPPFSRGNLKWQELMTCTRLMWDRFDIVITEEDPGDVPHIESIVSGYPSDLGLPGNVGGISPINGDCSVVERAIVFSFAEVYGNRMDLLCETVAQEAAHALGLDHEFLCEDPMTYIGGCGPKHFQDVDAVCGEDAPRPCRCDRPNQNSVQELLAVLGTSDPVPPEIAITEPADGATVPPGFTVRGTATDDQFIREVVMYVDGEKYLTLVADPFEFTAPVDLSFAEHLVELKAYDRGFNEVIAAVTVTVEAECATAAECAAGEDCGNGRCAPGLGSPCAVHADCASSLCALDDAGDLACTTYCSESVECPAGFACQDGTGLCFEDEGGGGGGCDAARAGTRGATAALGLFLLALAVFAGGRRGAARGRDA